jgi:DNA-directed RNA polymerase subunit H
MEEEKQIDVQKHTLVPKHELLGEEEVQALLEKYNLSLTQLPRIFLSDPAIQHLEPEVSQVMKITRNSPTLGQSTYYRVVVNG